MYGRFDPTHQDVSQEIMNCREYFHVDDDEKSDRLHGRETQVRNDWMTRSRVKQIRHDTEETREQIRPSRKKRGHRVATLFRVKVIENLHDKD